MVETSSSDALLLTIAVEWNNSRCVIIAWKEIVCYLID